MLRLFIPEIHNTGGNQMKGPKKEKLFCFPMECKYGSITLKKDGIKFLIDNIWNL